MVYDTIIATRNRPDVLRISIPTHLGQSRPPRELIVVDASDDHAPVAESVRVAAEACGRAIGDGVRVMHSMPPSSSRQRNEGMALSDADVLMFPDDDSLWFDGAAEAVMRIYERDTDGVIGGVSFHEHRSPPRHLLEATGAAANDERSLGEKLIYRFSPLRSQIERALVPSPMETAGRRLLAEHGVPGWLADVQATPVPYMHGFKMTYRGSALRAVGGFDETLSAYALYEDFDASYKVLRDAMLVQADAAGVYHHRAPGRRAGGRRTGAMLMLNLAYVTCRHSPPGSKTRQQLRRYAKVRYLQYLPRSRSEFGRERLEGFRRARRFLDEMIACPVDDMPALYLRAYAACTADD